MENRKNEPPQGEFTIMIDIVAFAEGPMSDEEILRKAHDKIVEAARSIEADGKPGKGAYIAIRAQREDGRCYDRDIGKNNLRARINDLDEDQQARMKKT